jgi:tape measure domain-containing protein
MTYQAEVRLSADPARLSAGMQQAASAVDNAFTRMRASIASVQTSMAAGINRVATQMGDLGRASTSAGENVERSMRRMDDSGGALGRLQSRLLGVAAALGTFATAQALAGTSDTLVMMDGRLRNLLGSAEESTRAQRELFAVAQRLQVPLDGLTAAFARMVPAINQMGGGVREAQRLAETLAITARLSGASTIEASASAQQFAQALGSGVLQGDELRSILENNNSLARALAKGLGVNVTELRRLGSEGQLTSEKVANALLGQYDRLKAEAAALPSTVGGSWTEVKNAFTQVVSTFEQGTGTFNAVAGAFQSIARVLEIAIRAFRDMRTESSAATEPSRFVSFGEFVGRVFAKIVDYGGAVVLQFRAIGSALSAIRGAAFQGMQGNLEQAIATLKGGLSEAVSLQGQAWQRLAGRDEGSVFRQFVQRDRTAQPGDTSASGRLGGDSTGGSRAGASRMAAFEAELMDRKLEIERAGGEVRAAYEAQFWQQKLASAQRVSAEYLQIRRRQLAAEARELQERQQAERASEQLMQQLDEIGIDRRRRSGLAALDASLENIRALVQGRVIAESEGLASQQDIERQRFAIEQQAMADRERLLGADLVARERFLAERERLEQEHQRRMQQLQLGEGLARRRESGIDGKPPDAGGQQQSPMFQGISQSFQTATRAILQQSQSFRQTMANIFMSIGDTMIQNLVIRPMAKTLASILEQSAAYKAMQGGLESVFGGIAELIISKKSKETAVVVGQNALQAGSGAAASQAGIPIIGPILAAAAMAAMISRVSSLASAKGGYDIPAGVNPLTQLHEREMVLPAEQAQVIREMAAGGSGGGQTVNHYTIHAMDAGSFETFLKKNPGALASGIQRASRNGYRA